MALRADMRGGPANLNDLKITFGSGKDGDGWYNPNDGVEEEEQPTNKVEQKVHIPNLSPRIIAAGGKVRITQSDGSLRTYDINVGDYID